MLSELWKYWTASCPEYVKKMGFLTESIGIDSRYKRCRYAWTKHLENSKKFILEGVDLCEKKDRVVVLGSGWLLDVPVEALARQFKEVFFVDLVKTSAVQKVSKKNSKVRFFERDVTGVMERLYQSPFHGAQKFDEWIDLIWEDKNPVSVRGLSELLPCDYMVSVNLLSQLFHVPLNFLEKKRKKDFSMQNVRKFQRKLCLDHVQLLQQSKRSCLITDVETMVMNEKHQLMHLEPLVTGVIFPVPHQEWVWNLAPLGEDQGNMILTRKVWGFHFSGSKIEIH